MPDEIRRADLLHMIVRQPERPARQCLRLPVEEQQIVGHQIGLMPPGQPDHTLQPTRKERIVGVKYRDPVALRYGQPLVARDRRSAILRADDQTDIVVCQRQFLRHSNGVVARRIVDDQNFDGYLLRQSRTDRSRQRILRVIGSNYHGYTRG